MATTTMVSLWREAKKLTEFERTSDGTAVFNHASIRTVSETDFTYIYTERVWPFLSAKVQVWYLGQNRTKREREGGGGRERAAVWTKLTVSDVVRRVTEHTNACLQAVFDSILDAYWRHFWWFPNSEVCAVYVCHSYTQPYHHYHFFPLENQLLSW